MGRRGKGNQSREPRSFEREEKNVDMSEHGRRKTNSPGHERRGQSLQLPCLGKAALS